MKDHNIRVKYTYHPNGILKLLSRLCYPHWTETLTHCKFKIKLYYFVFLLKCSFIGIPGDFEMDNYNKLKKLKKLVNIIFLI